MLNLILAILTAITLVSCAKQTVDNAPHLKLEAQPVPSAYILYDSRSSAFRIGNEFIERRISVDIENRRISTVAFINKLSGRNYIGSLGEEFSFRANGIKLSGVSGDFEYVVYETYGSSDVRELEINLRADRSEIGTLKVKLIYEVYSHRPIIRKWIEIENPGGSTVTIDSIQVETLSLLPGSKYDLEIYNGENLNPSATAENDLGTLSPTIFDVYLSEGFFTGNEAPGVLKHSDLYSGGDFVSIGMKPYTQSYAPEIQLAPDERFVSPAAFILLFKGDPKQAKESLYEFVAEYLSRSKTPEYSIRYESVAADTTEQQLLERAQKAKETNADIFCLNGKQDWTIEKKPYLGKLSQSVHDMGMKFGLCIKLAERDGQVPAEYSQWAVKLKDGSDCSLPDGEKIMCLGSEYVIYAAYEMDELVKELGVDYVKLTGQMITEGCFAKDHIHRSSAESLWYIYDGLFAIIKYLHSQHPDLIIDVSPESYNPTGTIDYALLKYADIRWQF